MHFCSRLLKPEPKEKGKAPAMIVFCAFDQIHTVAEYGAQYGFKNWYPIFFCKNYSAQVLKANMRIVGATEFAVVLYRDKLPKFNNGRQIGEDGKPIRGTGKMVFDWFQWERDGKDIPKIHPTQKPVKVLRRLIEIFTDPGELVIDPCCGSGSTLRAAAEAGRSAIGFEIDKSFYLAAKEKMLAGARGSQEAANFDGNQMTIGEITEAAQQGGRAMTDKKIRKSRKSRRCCGAARRGLDTTTRAKTARSEKSKIGGNTSSLRLLT